MPRGSICRRTQQARQGRGGSRPKFRVAGDTALEAWARAMRVSGLPRCAAGDPS